jgi:prepilin-type N-terminal cleavage/methylation domain-containing protein
MNNFFRRSAFTLIELLAVLAVCGILIALLLPLRRGSSEAARRTQCANNLKHIGLALYSYHDEYKAFPPAYTVDANGRPLHSWRTLILPYLEEKALYDTIDLTKPWDDPVNRKAGETLPSVYFCPGNNEQSNLTSYVAIVGKQTCLRPELSTSLADITDDKHLTLMVIEVPPENQVPWMSPQDANEESFLDYRSSSKLPHRGGVSGLVADSTVRFLSVKLETAVLRALGTINGNDDKLAQVEP